MGSGARVAHGALAAASALLAATAVATVDIRDKKLHPLLFYAVPVSLPLPPLEPLPNFFPPATPAYESSPFSLAQGATGAVSSLSRRAISHLLPVYLATSVTPPSVLRPRGFSVASVPPVLAHNSFSTSGLYRWTHSAHSVNHFESLLEKRSNFTQSLHKWHAPPRGRDERKPELTVVLLGWLGAQQKHLKKYAEWYNARGIHAVTFVIPMADILSFQVERNADEHVDSLARHLAHWLSEHDAESEKKQLLFHTFSNTGWLTYGVMLEKMQEQGDFVGRIKGCVIDSAPVPNPDPQVWASGFSAALLKKRSSATKPAALSEGELNEGVSVEAASQGALANLELGGANGLETALHSILQGFFSFFLKLPAINQRLSEVVTVLEKKQPPCPQLYIYSSADKVIPVKYVEAFIEEQRRSGRVVRACNLQSSPHVDHFRTHPQLYGEQLSDFLNEVLPSSHYNAAAAATV